jgi:hypothetical protein
MKLFLSGLKQKINLILKNSLINQMVRLYFFIMLLFGVILIWKWNSLPQEIPIYYSLPRSNEILGSKIQIFTLPLYSFIFFIINIIIAGFIYEKDKLPAEILVTAAIFVSFLLFITFLKIIFLIT